MKAHIDFQIEMNRSVNLFFKDFSHVMQFSQTAFDVFQNRELTNEDVFVLIEYTAEKVLRELCRVNQYYSFSENDIIALKNMYRNTYQHIQEKNFSSGDVFRFHFQNLRNWLRQTNPFTSGMYQEQGAVLQAAACFEYSSELQKDILCLDTIPLREPILDIGCGKNGALVKSLVKEKIDAHGIDRFSNSQPHFEKADWLTYNYGIKKWGTIVSNLGFSNHFVHHHLRNDEKIIPYAKKYIAILESLQIGGSFCYAPDLPFIESHLDKNTFSITKHDIKNMPFKTAIITRLN